MPSLPWILTLTLTYLHCLSARPTTGTEKIIKQRVSETLLQIETLNKTSCPTADTKFYIKSDVQKDHIKQMLECASRELEGFAEECFRDRTDLLEYYIDCHRTKDTIKQILENTGGQIPDKSTNLLCETWGIEKPYNEFLSDLKTLIQRLNNLI